MENYWLEGNLKDIPFSWLLYRIWQHGLCGNLLIQDKTKQENIFFQKGNIIIEKNSFPQEEFINDLVNKQKCTPSFLQKSRKFASQNNISIIKALTELNYINPYFLWEHMEKFYKQRLYPFFDLTSAYYSIRTDNTPLPYSTLFFLSTLDLIREGISQMENLEIIESYLPSEDENLQLLSPFHLHQLQLLSPEKYVFRLIENGENLKNIYNKSELGKKKTQKIIFSFLSLGLAGLSIQRTNQDYTFNFSASELEKIFQRFNHQCTYIHKYMAKKIGPVALNILKKCVEETKSNLPPLFQKIELLAEGKMNMKPILKANVSLSSPQTKRKILKGLNELLAAEILCVKKTLGKEHETTVVKQLEKMRGLD